MLSTRKTRIHFFITLFFAFQTCSQASHLNNLDDPLGRALNRKDSYEEIRIHSPEINIPTETTVLLNNEPIESPYLAACVIGSYILSALLVAGIIFTSKYW